MTPPALQTRISAHHPPSHYEILQISLTATEEEIKRAYRSLIVRIHPDKNVMTHSRAEATSCRGGKVEHVSCSLADIDDDDQIHIQSCDANIDAVSAYKEEHCSLEQETNKLSNASEGEHFTFPNDTRPAREQIDDNSSSKFHQIQAAYNTLRDANKRAAYDQSLQRQKDREAWKYNGAMKVNLSEMESDVCCVEYADNNLRDAERKESLQTVYFYPCRCGDTFEIVREELVDELTMGCAVWHCESCSLAIRICVDVDVTHGYDFGVLPHQCSDK